jgi:hypothetical protein
MTAATKAKWRITGEWATAANITGTAWRSPDDFVIDEVNEEGLTYRYEMLGIYPDGVNVWVAKAQACYGLVNTVYANSGTSAWMDAVLTGLRSAARLGIHGVVDLCAKHPTLTCDEMMHAAQVLLENEDCDGCEPCTVAASLV